MECRNIVHIHCHLKENKISESWQIFLSNFDGNVINSKSRESYPSFSLCGCQNILTIINESSSYDHNSDFFL